MLIFENTAAEKTHKVNTRLALEKAGFLLNCLASVTEELHFLIKNLYLPFVIGIRQFWKDGNTFQTSLFKDNFR